MDLKFNYVSSIFWRKCRQWEWSPKIWNNAHYWRQQIYTSTLLTTCKESKLPVEGKFHRLFGIRKPGIKTSYIYDVANYFHSQPTVHFTA